MKFVVFNHTWGPAHFLMLTTYLVEFSLFSSKCKSRKMSLFYWRGTIASYILVLQQFRWGFVKEKK